MANLVCYIPFPRIGRIIAQGCLRTEGNELVQYAQAQNAQIPPTRNGVPLTQLNLVYLNEETPQNRLGVGDVLVVFAHGGDNDTELSDNAGNDIEQNDLLQRLVLLNAAVASEIYFFACFSALPEHIGPTFKSLNGNIRVYGKNDTAEGGLAKYTRTGFRTAVWKEKQLVEV